ncbi:hypothetical protein AX14_006166, partial [Amanita brunnescens Koide BX004]
TRSWTISLPSAQPLGASHPPSRLRPRSQPHHRATPSAPSHSQYATPVHVTPSHSRPTTGDPNYLAVGLDIVRGDPSAKPLLQIPRDAWSQPQAQVSPLCPRPSSFTEHSSPAIPCAIEPQHPRADPRIPRQHAAGEFVSALALCLGQPVYC